MRVGGTRKFQIAGFLLTLATAFGLPGPARAQQAPVGQGYTIGILPFSDLSGNSQLGQLSSVLPGMMQNSLAQHSELVPRQIQPAMGAVPNATNAQAIDATSAAQLGQMNGTSVVLGGTLLNGEVSTKQGSFSGGHLGGMQLGGNTNQQSSTVTIQAVLIDAARGTSLGTFRATGQDTETHIDPNATTNYGSMNMQSGDFQNTSLAKAAQKAVDDLTRQIVAALKGFTPTAAAAGAPAQSQAPGQSSAPQQVQAAMPTQSQVLVFGDKDLFGTQFANGVDPTTGAQLQNLVAGQVSNAADTYAYTTRIQPGMGDLGGQPEYPGTDQLYVSSRGTPPDSTIQRGPETIVMDYSSLVPAGQQVSGLTLGMSVTGFVSPNTGMTYTAQLNGQINVPLSRQLNSLQIGANVTQFFTIGVDPKVLNSNSQLTLQIDATDPQGWNKGWAIDFLTISVTTVPIPSAQGSAAAQGGPMQTGSTSPNQPKTQNPPPSDPAVSSGMPSGSGVMVPTGTAIEAKYADGSSPTLQPSEQVAFLFLATINSLERDYCLPTHAGQNLGRPCTLDELVNGVNSGGKIVGLSQDPRQDPNYRYTLQTLGTNYEIAATPQSGGIGGFLLDSGAGQMIADFRYKPGGAATLADKKFSEYGFSGKGFLRR